MLPYRVFSSVPKVFTGSLRLVAAGGLLVDGRELLGQPICAKPAEFAVSMALYTPTLG